MTSALLPHRNHSSIAGRTAAVLAAAGLALLAGCGESEDRSPATAAPPSSSSSSTGSPEATEISAAPEPSSAGAPGCPEQGELFALLPADAEQDLEPAMPSAAATCADGWALIAVAGDPGSGVRTHDVRLFQHDGGPWTPVDTQDACSGGALPDALVTSACRAS